MVTRRPKNKNMSAPHEEQMGFDFTMPNIKPIRLWSADELYDCMSEHVAVDAKEDDRIERKSARYSACHLGDYFSMWANTPPDGGLILVGVENDGKVTGCRSIEISHLNELQRAGDVYCPEARYQSKKVSVKNFRGEDDYIIALRVLYREDRVVETVALNAFIRRGSSKKLLSDSEKRELQLLKGQLEIESEPVSLQYPEDFNATLIAQFVGRVREDRRMPSTLSTEDVLCLRRLGKITSLGFVPNLACALLFARDPQSIVPGCKIRFLRFDGTEEKAGREYNAIKSAWIEGSVPQLIQGAESVVDAQIREFMRLGDNNQFYSTPEYPKDAWYEAIVNACVHRSYNLANMHIVIKMFDDRLEIESPGSFPPMVTPENIYDMHVPRNPHLMDAMFYLKFVLCSHEGTRRIRDSMIKLGLPAPVFRQTESSAAYVRVTLKNDVEHRTEFIDTQAYLVLGEALIATLNAFDIRIINYVAEHGKINITEASRVANRRWHSTKKMLMSLVERGILDHVHNADIDRDAYQYFTLKKRFSDKLKTQAGTPGSK
jgi:ATP-dependent DNA helicase RecG